MTQVDLYEDGVRLHRAGVTTKSVRWDELLSRLQQLAASRLRQRYGHSGDDVDRQRPVPLLAARRAWYVVTEHTHFPLRESSAAATALNAPSLLRGVRTDLYCPAMITVTSRYVMRRGDGGRKC